MTDKMTNQEAIDRLKLIRSPYIEVAVDMAIEALQAEPVKHGEWVNIFDNTWECTNCEMCEQFTYNIESTSNYCPNCGAKMDGKE